MYWCPNTFVHTVSVTCVYTVYIYMHTPLSQAFGLLLASIVFTVSVRTQMSLALSEGFHEIQGGNNVETSQSALAGSQLTSEQLWFGHRLH